MKSRRVLIDQYGPPMRMRVDEGQDGGKLIVSGKIGHVDKATANNRVYPRAVMEREVNRLQERINQGSVLGAVDHPGDGKSRVRDAGCIMRALKIERSGEVHGTFEVVEESDAGRNLAAFMRRGAAIGMSSRGLGSTALGPDGHDYVGEDFRLSTWDFVADPACHDAYPRVMSEDVDAEGNEILTLKKGEVNQQALRTEFPELVREIEEHAFGIACATVEEDAETRIRTDVEGMTEEALVEAKAKIREDVKVEIYRDEINSLREDFAAKLVRALAEMRTAVEEEVRSDFNSDPELAGAKLALAKISEMVSPFQPEVDVKRLLDEKDGEIEELRQAVIQQESSGKDAEIAELQIKGKALAYQVYIEQQIAAHPAAAQIREMIGSPMEITSTEDLKSKVAAALEAVDNVRKEAAADSEEELKGLKNEWAERIQRAEEEANGARERESKLRESVDRQVAGLQAQITEMLESNRNALRERDEKIATQARVLAEAVENTDRAQLLTYAANRTLGHAKRDQILEDVQAGRLRTQADIDLKTTSLEEGAQVPGGPIERIRRAMGKGRENLTEDERVKQEQQSQHVENTGNSEADRDLAVLGTSLFEQTNLAGIVRPTRR
jgi:hypothetical protein